MKAGEKRVDATQVVLGYGYVGQRWQSLPSFTANEAVILAMNN